MPKRAVEAPANPASAAGSNAVLFTPLFLNSLPAAAPGKRYERRDTKVSGLIVRVTESGAKTLMLKARFAAGEHMTRRKLAEWSGASGDLGATTLKDARTLAQDWLTAIRRGDDPGDAIKAQAAVRRAAKVTSEHTFEKVAAEYLRTQVVGWKVSEAEPVRRNDDETKQRAAHEVVRQFDNVLTPEWGPKAVKAITKKDVQDLVGKIAEETPAMARNIYATIRSFFKWVQHTAKYEMEKSPCDGISPVLMFGEPVHRKRTLNDLELRLLWRNLKRLHLPYQVAYRLLLLTALRLNEVARAERDEFDGRKREWTIPAARMKAKKKVRAVPHLVPVTTQMSEALSLLSRHNEGDFVLSMSAGVKPLNTWSRQKALLDVMMLRTLKALRRLRGESTKGVTIPRWTNHDLRRTVRSRLSAIPGVTEETREAILAHVRPGIKGVYDHHEYAAEKRAALEQWNARLMEIVSVAPRQLVDSQH